MANFHEFDFVGTRQRPFHDLLAARPHLVATAGKADLAASSAETLRQIASQIASASLASFLLLFTYGFTNWGDDQLHRESLLLQLAGPMVRSAATLHADLAAWLIRAVEECLPRSLRQRYLAHKLRNLESKVPAELWREAKGQALAAYHASSPKIAEMATEDFRTAYAMGLPSAVKCFDDGFAVCVAYLKLPVAHRRATRTTNLVERQFLEERRRTKTIPHAFGEKAVLKLMYAVLDRASRTWQRVANIDFE
jgi:transposase-like protein